MKFPIGIQLFSVRDEITTALEGILKQLKDMGYDGVEFAGMYDYTPEQLRDLCARIGLNPISAHVSIDQLLEDGCIAAYKQIGCRYIAIPWLAEEKRPGHPGYAQFLKDATKIAQEAKEQGITLLYHNHDFEFVKVNGEYALDVMYREIPALQTELDTCWVKVAGEDPVAYLHKYSGRAPVVHLKDFVGQKTEHMYQLVGVDDDQKQEAVSTFEFRPVGSGVQDFPAILAAAEEAGTSWVIVEQDLPSMGLSSLECARKSIEYLRSL